MEARIKVLDEKVISQIAAGEVIERPGSVVKELLENSIDAKAENITIKIEDGGKKLIKIVDDGVGIPREDADVAFLRHATSKIFTLRDLESISSLGFRGEALASIAAVSKVTLITKSRLSKSETGCEISVEGGKRKYTKDQAANYGTTVEVRDLFYNIPARRKFLKTSRVELAKITDIVTRCALIHPEIFFRLEHEGSEILNAPKTDSLLENIVHIYGKEIAREMLKISHSEPDLQINGFISKPGVTRGSASHISVFVNNRYINSKLLSSAIKDGYSNMIMKNRHPVAVISISIPPRHIDVNVHPAKLEIKFQDEKKVYSSLSGAVKSTLQNRSLIPHVGSSSIESSKLEAFEIERGVVHILSDTYPSQVEATRQVNIETFPMMDKKGEEFAYDKEYGKGNIPKMSVIGQILNTYIVAESGDNILIIDQHAAHERILFEKLMDFAQNRKKIHQELVSPLSIELNPQQKVFVTNKKEILESLGFKLDHLGGNTYHVRSVPAVMGEMHNTDVLYDIIDDLSGIKKTSQREEIDSKAMAVVACHSAIRGGMELSFAQMKDLIRDLYVTKNVTSCPHGRPSILSLSKSEIERMFKRKL